MDYLSLMENGARERHIPVMGAECKKILIEEIKKRAPRRILEIGTAIGYSGAHMLLSCTGDLVTVELNPSRCAEAAENFAYLGLSERVTLCCGDALSVLPTVLEGEYDFVFIDAQKSKYAEYFDLILPFTSDNAVIAADNVYFKGLVNAEFVPRKHRTIVRGMRAFLERIKVCADVTVMDADDGLALIRVNRNK